MKKITLLTACLLSFFAAIAQPPCNLAIPIQCGAVILGDSTAGASNGDNVNTYGLGDLFGSGSGGPERIFKLTVTQTATYRFVLDILNGKDLDMFVLQPFQLPCSFASAPLVCLGGGFTYEYNLANGVYREVLDLRLEASPNPYYIFIDGKASPSIPYSGRFNFTVDCTCSSLEAPNDLPTGEAIFCDDFENYIPNQILEPQSTRWEIRASTQPNATVTSSGFSGNGARFAGTANAVPDEFFLLRNRYSSSVLAGQSSGRYRMSWKMRVEHGKKGYFNIAHQTPIDSIGGPYNLASHVTFLENGLGELRAGSISSNPIASFSYPPGTWMNVVQIVDVDANKAELWINNNFIKSWAFNIGDNGNSSRLAAINFKAANGYDFKIDELCVWKAGSPCSGPGSAVMVENGVTYPSQAAARCALYTSLEWGGDYSICDYGGTFIHRGDTYSGVLDVSDLAPNLLRSDPCVLAAYGGILPDTLYSDIYIFNKNDNQIADVIFNGNGNPSVRQFVFACNSVDNNGNCQQGQQCLTEVSTGVYLPNTCDSFYYVVVTSGRYGDTYSVSIIPEGLCGTNYTQIPLQCGETYDCSYAPPKSGHIGHVSKFNAIGLGNAYASCYNGNRTYLGGDVVYQIKLENPALIKFKLNATSPMGLALYAYICASDCIGFKETNEFNQIEFEQPLLEGTYFIILDKSFDSPQDSFYLEVMCQTKTFFDIQSIIGSGNKHKDDHQPQVMNHVPSICLTCDLPAINHQVIVQNQGLFSEFDQIHFMFRDSSTGFLTGSPLLSRTWSVGIIPGNSQEFLLPLDYDNPNGSTNSTQCSYKNGQVLNMYVSQSGNGNHLFRKLIPTFVPIGTNSATGGGIFSAGAISSVSYIELGSPVTWYIDKPIITATDAASTGMHPLNFFANIPWKVTEVPNAPWLTLSDTFSLIGYGLHDLNLTFTQNTSLLPRSTTLRFVSSADSTVYRLYARVTQLAPCTPPQITPIGNNLSYCEQETVILTANVGADPATNESLAPLYKFVWKKGAVVVDSGVGAPHDRLILPDLNAGNHSYTVTVLNQYCDGIDTETFTITVSAPPLPPWPSSTLDQTICGDDPIPSFSVMPPPVGQVVQWYETMTGGTPIFTGPTFTPALKQTNTYYAGTQLSNGGCESNLRIAFTLTVNPLPTLQITGKACTEDHQFYEFTILSNAGSVTVDGAPFTPVGGVVLVNNVGIGTTVTVVAKATGTNCDTMTIVSPPVCTCDVNAPVKISDFSFCENTPAPISVTVTQPNVVVDWYDDSIGGNKINLQPANPFLPPFPYLPVYYAQARNTLNNCVSSRTAVQLTVNTQPTLMLTDTTCTQTQDFYSISLSTNGINATANPWSPGFSGGIYTFDEIPVAQSITITTTSNNGCTRIQTVNPPNCPCLSLAAPVSGGDVSICFGDTYPSLSVMVGNDQTANWYLNSTPIATGTTTLLPPSVGVYTVETFDSGLNCTSSEKITVQFEIFPEIQFTVSPTTCAYNRQSYGFSITAGTGKSVTVNGSNIPGNNGIFTVNGITVGTNAQIVVTDLSTNCSKEQTIVSPTCPCVEVINQPGTSAANTLDVCQGDAKTLTVSLGPDQTANWYNDQNIQVAQGLSFMPGTQNPGTFTYFAEAFNFVTSCAGPVRRSITFTVNPAPTFQIEKTCENQTTYVVTATVMNANTLTATFGQVSSTGNGIFTISGVLLNQETQLTATNTTTSCSANFTVTPPPSCDCGLLGTINTPTPGPDQKACVGQLPFPFVTATVNQADVVVDWYDANGALLLQGNSQYPVPGNLAPGIYTYFAEARNSLTNCTSNNRAPVKITVNALPTLQISNTLCEGDYLTYKAQGQTEPGNVITATEGSVNNLPSGFFEITGIDLGTASDITVTNNTTNCQSIATVFLATCPCPQVNTPISNGDKTMCAGDPSAPVLSVTVSSPTTETADWFLTSSGGIPFHTGLNYQPIPPPGSSISYFVQARLSSPNVFCPSSGRQEVRLDVRAKPVANAGIDQTICASDTLSLAGSISGVTGGFWAASGGQFLPNNGALTAQQFLPPPGAAQVTLTLVTDDPSGPCLAVSDEMLLTILPSPVFSIVSVDCNPNFQSYNVVFTSTTNILNTSPLPATLLSTGEFQVSNIPIGQDLSILGFNTANNCDRTITVPSPSPCPCPTVAQPVSDLTDSVSVCFGSAIPTLHVTIPNGTIANWYQDPTGGSPFLENMTEYTPTLPGDYFVEALDPLNNCRSARTKITVSIKPAPSVSIGPDANYCPGSSITLSGDSGNGYTYHWSTGQNSQSISVSQAGLYLVTVTLNGCTALDSFHVGAFPALLADILTTDSITCFGYQNGSITANGFGGLLPVAAYFWSTQSGLQTLSGLDAGTYTVTIVDQNSCTATDVITLVQPEPLQYSNLNILPGSNGQANGSITGQVGGGTPPYQFQWYLLDSILATQTSSSIDSIPPGNYALQITDALGCTYNTGLLSMGTVGSMEPTLDQYIQLFPNPTTGKVQLRISLPNTALIELKVLDILGRELMSSKPALVRNTTLDLDLSAFAEGLYWVKIKLDDDIVVKKVSVFR